jgi:hypothetical protein
MSETKSPIWLIVRFADSQSCDPVTFLLQCLQVFIDGFSGERAEARKPPPD